MEHSCPPRRSSALARLIGQNEVNAIRASDSRPNDVPHRKAAEGFLFLPFDLLLRRGTATPGNESRDTDDDPASQGQLRIFRARSEEHTSELQSLMRISYSVFCLKKKKIYIKKQHYHKHQIKRRSNHTTNHNTITYIQPRQRITKPHTNYIISIVHKQSYLHHQN